MIELDDDALAAVAGAAAPRHIMTSLFAEPVDMRPLLCKHCKLAPAALTRVRRVSLALYECVPRAAAVAYAALSAAFVGL